MSRIIDRRHYADMFGPTTGDRVRLGDTGLVAEVERDFAVVRRRVQVRRRQGPARRPGPARRRRATATRSTASSPTRSSSTATGIYKADIGIKGGRIAGIGKAGNPDVMAGRHARDGRRRDHGGDRGRGPDRHRGRHRLAHPLHLPAAGARGARERASRPSSAAAPGPATGTNATTCTPGVAPHRADAPGDRRASRSTSASRARATRRRPKASSTRSAPARSASSCTRTGARRRAAIDCCLGVAEGEDVQVTIHTDTLNESGYVDDSIAAFKGRTIHTYHSEGAGGGHAPDIIRVCGEPNVIPSSTNPTRPFTVNTLDEHLDMLMVCHHLDKTHPRGRRVRREPHPRRDDRRRGHPARPRRDQHHLERQPGHGPRRRGHRADLADRRQDAKRSAARSPASEATTTTRASSATSRSTRSTRPSRTAWRTRSGASRSASGPISCSGARRSSACRPELVIKGGFIAWAQMGDANASIPTPQPLLMRPMFGALGRAAGATSIAFVSQRAAREGGLARARARQARRAGAALPGHRQARHGAQRRAAAHHGRSRDVRGPRRRRAPPLRARRRSSRWRSSTHLF